MLPLETATQNYTITTTENTYTPNHLFFFFVVLIKNEIIINCTKIFYRKLLTISMWNPVRPFNGLLSDPDLYPIWIDCHYIVGILLVKQKCNTSTCCAWRHHCVDNDHTHVVHQCSVTKNFLRQIDRRLSGHMFRHGFC